MQAYDPSNDEYAQVLDNTEVGQELIINTNNSNHEGHIVGDMDEDDGGGGCSEQNLSEQTTTEDYVVESMDDHTQHIETCPSVAVVLDDEEIETVIEPDVILPALLNVSPTEDMDNSSSPGPSPVDIITQCENFDFKSTSGSFNRGSNLHSHRSARKLSLRRQNHQKYIGNTANDTGIVTSSSSGANGRSKGGSGTGSGRICDEYTAFGITVAAKLSKMDTYQRLYAENIINQTLFKGLMNQLEPPSNDFWFNPAAAIKKETNN